MQTIVSKLLEQRAKLCEELAELDRTIREVATSGTSAASISSSGGAKSYTRISLAELNAQRSRIVSRVRALDARLCGRSPIRHIMTVRG